MRESGVLRSPKQASTLKTKCKGSSAMPSRFGKSSGCSSAARSTVLGVSEKIHLVVSRAVCGSSVAQASWKHVLPSVCKAARPGRAPLLPKSALCELLLVFAPSFLALSRHMLCWSYTDICMYIYIMFLFKLYWHINIYIYISLWCVKVILTYVYIYIYMCCWSYIDIYIYIPMVCWSYTDMCIYIYYMCFVQVILTYIYISLWCVEVILTCVYIYICVLLKLY